MATKPVDGHRHLQHAHLHNNAQRHELRLQREQQAHNGANKPTKADKSGQAQQAPPLAAAGAPGPDTQHALNQDQFTPQNPAPVNLTPGATASGRLPRRRPPAGRRLRLRHPRPRPPRPKRRRSRRPGSSGSSQADPKGDKKVVYTNGAMNCGPASGAMFARAAGYGADLSDAALVNKLAGFGQTDSGRHHRQRDALHVRGHGHADVRPRRART